MKQTKAMLSYEGVRPRQIPFSRPYHFFPGRLGVRFEQDSPTISHVVNYKLVALRSAEQGKQ